MFEGFVQLKEAKKISGTNIETLKKQCQEGKIPGAVKQGKAWFIPRSSLINKKNLLDAYTKLKKKEFNKHDDFFGIFGPGNTINIILQPYERLKEYEAILHAIKTADSKKYDLIHKGTPYYFLSWLAFTIEDYEKAVFYMDAAASEDIRTFANGDSSNITWHSTPAGTFLLLDSSLAGPTARHITQEVENELNLQFSRFNDSTGAHLDKHLFIEKFVKPKIPQASFRSIISALYVFVLEYKTRSLMFTLKGPDEGSIEPFLIHLFKGCLIFESLMKSKYSAKSKDKTLGGYLLEGQKDLQIGQVKSPLYKSRKEWSFEEIINLLPSWRSELYQEKIIAITFASRNTTGHDLGWSNLLTDVIYEELFESILDTIFWYVWSVEVQ